MKARNLLDPILGGTDGAPGLIRAFEEVFSRSLRQRCLVDTLRNLQSKVPEQAGRELKGAALAAYPASSPKLARIAKEDFVARCGRQYPSARASFLEDFDAGIAPSCRSRTGVWHARPTSLSGSLARSAGAHQGDPARFRRARRVETHVYAALIRASQTSKHIGITPFELGQLERLREHLNRVHAERTAPAQPNASRSRISSRNGTGP